MKEILLDSTDKEDDIRKEIWKNPNPS